MDKFYTQKNCNRCGKPLDGGRTMSRFNTDCIEFCFHNISSFPSGCEFLYRFYCRKDGVTRPTAVVDI